MATNNQKSKISNVEWGLFIGALVVVDLAQIVLEWILIGFLLNPLIDIFVGMAIPFYLHIRGENIADSKRIFGFIGTFFGEMIPGVDELPLWTLDGIYNMFLSKSEAVLEQVPGGKAITSATEKSK